MTGWLRVDQSVLLRGFPTMHTVVHDRARKSRFLDSETNV